MKTSDPLVALQGVRFRLQRTHPEWVVVCWEEPPTGQRLFCVKIVQSSCLGGLLHTVVFLTDEMLLHMELEEVCAHVEHSYSEEVWWTETEFLFTVNLHGIEIDWEADA